MSETRTIHDPFLNKDFEVGNKLTDRLRGRYACGPVTANGEPEFGWRQFETPPIQHEAADKLESAATELAALREQLAEWKQAAGVEASLRREFLARAETAERELAQTRARLAMRNCDLEESERKLAEARELLEGWSYDGHLQTFGDRERFRRAARTFLEKE